MSHGAHSAGDMMLLLGIFVLILIMLIGGFIFIYRPLKAESDTTTELESDRE